MRKLTAIVIVMTALWGGYWFIGARAVETGLSAWFADRHGEGWVADYTELKTRGFPSRFDTTITGLDLADPDTGLAWSAPFFQILSLSYKPTHIIAIWPDIQTLATPEQRIEIAAADMRGSVVFDVGTDLPLNRSSIVLQGMGFSSTRGWSSYLESGQFATRQSVGRPNTYDVSFEARNLTPASEFIKSLDSGDLLPGVIDGMSIDATLEFDAPWDRFAIERARPQITRLDLKLLKADWGKLDLWMAGEVSVDAEGIPSGEITVKARNWREMLQIARATGVLPEALAPTVEQALGFLSALSNDPETLDAPLTISNGLVSLGVFPIGRTPRLTIR